MENNSPAQQYKIFAINPGSTSTKIALFEGETMLFSSNVEHEAAELKKFPEISDQFGYRKDKIIDELARHDCTLEGTDAFVGRGGGLVSLEGGTYPVNEKLLQHARVGFTVKHPATLGSQLAYYFSQQYGGKAFVVNPPDVDEFDELARVTGLKGIYRESRIHALNQKEIGYRYARQIGRKYEDLNLVIAHIGGGTSVTAHKSGRMVDSNDIVHGDGPMAPTRSGAVPVSSIIKLCFSGEFTESQLHEKTTKSGGFVDHLGTANVKEILERIKNGDAYSKLIYDAFIYQIAKSIGAYATVLCGKVDAILLTGGIAKDAYLVAELKKRVEFIAPISVYAGEFEMEALASGAVRVLDGSEKGKIYTGEPIWNGFEKQ